MEFKKEKITGLSSDHHFLAEVLASELPFPRVEGGSQKVHWSDWACQLEGLAPQARCFMVQRLKQNCDMHSAVVKSRDRQVTIWGLQISRVAKLAGKIAVTELCGQSQ